MCNDNYHFYVVRHGRQWELFSASSDCIPYRMQVLCGRILHSVEQYSFVVFFGGGRTWLITGYISRVSRRMPPVDCLPFLSIWAYFRLFWEPYLSIFMLCLMLSRSLSVLLSFFFCPLYFLSFFDLRLRLTRFGNFRLFLEVKLHYVFCFHCKTKKDFIF